MKGISDFYISDSFVIKVCEINNEVFINNNGKESKIDAGLWYPRGVDFFEGKIYITDSYNFSIKVFDLDGRLEKTFGNNILREPYGIKIVDKKIYVIDKDNGYVRIFSLDGEYISSFEKKMKYPSLIDFDGTNFFVTNTNGNTVEVFDSFGKNICSLKAQMKYPVGIAVTLDRVFVGDEFNKRICVFSKDGTFEGVILENSYISLLKIDKNKLYFYDDKNGILDNKELLEINIKKIEIKTKKKDYPNRTDLLKREIHKVSDDFIERPRGIAFDGNSIWTALFNKKIIVSISEESNINNYFSSDIMIDKLAVTENEIWFLDYFYRKIYILDKKTGDAKSEMGISVMESPIDFKLRNNRVTVLDSVLKKIFVFNLSGKLLKEFSIEGLEPVSFDFVDEEYFILDKRSSKVYIYNDTIKTDEIFLDEAKYPESIAVSELREIFIADEVNGRILKINKEKKIEFEIAGMAMPKDVVYKDGLIFVTDFGNDLIKIYKAR